MAAKIRCPGCGAKNDAAAYRCRICTAMINPGAEPPAVEEPPAPVGIDHFDPGDIQRQVRPARERFGSTGGALSARIAAASGPPTEAPTDTPTETPPTGSPVDGEVDDFADDFVPPLPPRAPSPTVPIEYEGERFDPDALFRDMG